MVGAKLGDGSGYCRMDGTVVGRIPPPILAAGMAFMECIAQICHEFSKRLFLELPYSGKWPTAARLGAKRSCGTCEIRERYYCRDRRRDWCRWHPIGFAKICRPTVHARIFWLSRLSRFDLKRKTPEMAERGTSNLDGRWKHFMVYPVRSGQLLNYVGFVPTEDETVRSWSAIGDRNELASSFEGWDPRVVGLLEKVDTCFWWGLYDRRPLASWTNGRLALLGDAAHAMLPHLGQGANQAIEDGVALAVFLWWPELSRSSRRFAALRSFSPRTHGRRSGRGTE